LRRGRHRAELNAEINVVSLIDVMMLLLVIFMITAPMMQGGIEVKLPQGEPRPLDAKSGVVVTITDDGSVYLDKSRMTFAEFKATFKTLAGERGKVGVYLQVDARVTAQRIVEVMDVAKNAGVENIGFVIQSTEGAR
jgi:biopolymer transport protein ExbD/biopolymer transport protein TolR